MFLTNSSCKMLDVVILKVWTPRRLNCACKCGGLHQFPLIYNLCKMPTFKNHEIFQKWDHFENQTLRKGYSPCKILTFVKNWNSKKHVKIHSTNHLELFCEKNRSKKHQIFQKWEHFENRPSCIGYSPCKILFLAQKLKFKKTCQNPFYKSFRVLRGKNPLQKTRNIPEMRPFWKSAIMQRL